MAEPTLSLAELLSRTTRLTDLGTLARALGAQGPWVDLPPAAAAAGLALAGTVAGFTWLAAVVDGTPPAGARRLARKLQAQGRCGGVLALYPRARLLAIAAGESCLVCALDGTPAASLACLAVIQRLPHDRWYAERVALALAGRPAGTAFQNDFRRMLDRFTEVASGESDATRRQLALIQLTRLLFLYFVQSKGWLDGRADFLRAELDRCLASRRSVHRHLIQPLFFGVLNREHGQRSRAVHRLGHIPFLNGGLFEPHALERRMAAIPDALWRDAMDELFERYHFTTREDDGDHWSIAPDMLGQVFEGVMAPATRKQTGTYYTPAPVVARVVDAALAALVAVRLELPEAEACERLERRDSATTDVVLAARILDPACGSGAFLLGALERLAGMRAHRGEDPAQARRAVLRNNLFGVDIDPMAVRLAELRLWLSVAAEEPGDARAPILPLPNLDALIRQGDSLAEPAFMAHIPAGVARQLTAARQQLIDASGQQKRTALRQVRQLELRAATESLAAAEQRARHVIDDMTAAGSGPDLFGAELPMAHRQRRQLVALRRERERLAEAKRQVVREGRIPWFSYAGHFGDVMAAGGFDLVVGNPPWVRAECLPPGTREFLQDRYRAWRTTGRRGFGHLPDLSVAFVERGLELLAPGGVLAMVLPTKVATAGYGEAIRGLILARSTVHALAPLAPDQTRRFGATVYPMVLLASRQQSTGQPPRLQLEPTAGVLRTSLTGPAPWILGGGDKATLIARLCESHPRFGESFRCRLGVKTGADRVFVDPDGIEAEILRPVVRGRDISPFSATARHRLLWGYDATGRILDALPPGAARWIAAHRPALLARHDHDAGPPWQLFRTRGALDRHRLAWRDLSRRLVAAPLIGPLQAAVPLNSCYLTSAGSRGELLAAAAWLNSRIISAIASAGATEANGGYRRFHAGVIAALPWPSAARTDETLISIARAARDGSPALPELDARVASLLGLTRREQRALLRMD